MGEPFPFPSKLLVRLQTTNNTYFLKLFLALNSSYPMYHFWHLGDTKYSLGFSFMALDTGEM